MLPLENQKKKALPVEHSNPTPSFLGIECGGTRTIALFASDAGKQVLRTELGPANLKLLDDASLIAHFKAVDEIRRQVPSSLSSIGIGMAGARTDADRKRIRAAAAVVWPNVPCYATNDLEIAMTTQPPAAKSNFAARILVLSGTGSCCYGQMPCNATAKVGGWGHILGDKGSGYEIGLRALKAVVYYLDRDGHWSDLGRRILRSLLLNEPEELVDWVKNASKSEISALAIEVFAAAAAKDKIAQDILEGAAASLAKDGSSCALRLVKKKAKVEFLLAGSVLLKQPAFAARVRSKLKEHWPGATVTLLEREGAWGALQLAQEQIGSKSVMAGVATEISPDASILPVSLSLSPTEERNPRSLKLDRLSVANTVTLMLEEESGIGPALLKEKRNIERAVSLVVSAFRRGGRLFYVGAGTSGRLGVLDASECPPTFRTPAEQVQGIIAGAQSALWRSIEGAEDSPTAGASAIEFRGVNKSDVVIGIAASGRTPFVWGALRTAKAKGARTVLICFNPNLKIARENRPDLVIAPNVGPELLTGSTRLKSGTATKIILNTITTLSMVQMGKVLSNLMIDVAASNTKLRDRAMRIVQAVTGADSIAAQTAL
ncbi:MAG TPA: N-acetylmuramic acid 6-phosphate etherase, partial [Verrucomicrobiae bacterium]|nr:N-acetylmuramic acid 6-phosphate etherase [Verrucomicrobiae bacterium]